MNRVEYELVQPMLGSRYFKWTLHIDDYVISGQAVSVRQVYRRARKAAKRHKKLQRLINE